MVFHSPISNLTRPEQVRARAAAVQAAMLVYHHRGSIHYTQGWRRWDGIRLHLVAALGHFPNYADCSAMVSWEIFQGLGVIYHRPDVVNGQNWRGGFTGTLMTHGKRQTVGNCLPGDAVIYGRGYPGEHTALVVGRSGRTPMVVSHGSEAGPFYLPYNYRSDVIGFWRYI